ncbi:MAG: hypothetical protein O9270_18615 [Aquidulcibacter sp.]|jgi:hypothetical protein|uniref:hypothetical protein n=1 Tax=Aquidulcibacter sp. TaxID=2052990 RepID=UPI0022CA654A|nr:hypothetical protein [Aquidulcibacter sp.]MCE2892409.1 hypothetical protein [Hyphomonadaceae bacterium]MCZ8210195.1 hypothetical protein [Aquidulcibacter sp.]
MPKIKLDIAGMYFSFEANVAAGACVKDVMDDVAVKTRAPDYKGPRFRYTTETIGTFLSLNGIRIDHENGSAVSRQDATRVYPDGIYRYDDDAVDFKNGLLVGTDPTKNYVLAWQFYVYDKNGVEHARTNGTKRSIISFAEKNPAKMGYVLEDGSTVVWRLVAIFYKPL